MKIRYCAAAALLFLIGCDSNDMSLNDGADKKMALGVATATTVVGYPKTSYSNMFTFRLDTENNGNDQLQERRGDFSWTSLGRPSVSSSGTIRLYTEQSGGVEFRGTSESRSSLPTLPFDYLVWRVSSTCPSNSYPVGIYLDTDNDNNQDQILGTTPPGAIVTTNGGGIRMSFCFVPKGTTSLPVNSYQAFGGSGSIFANLDAVPTSAMPNSNPVNIRGNKVYVDLQDEFNENKWTWGSLSYDFQNRIKAIVYLNRSSDLELKTINWDTPVGTSR